jgi:rhamnose utilization protein RhaD (predicted bifunctional aldolase and dehydrogenase)
LLIESAVKDNPGADGLILGSHGLFTWGATQRECYLNSIRTIDQMGAFIDEHRAGAQVFGGLAHQPLGGRLDVAARILPALRGTVSSNRRVIAHFTDTDQALAFAGSEWAKALSRLGTSCPDHFLRTRICPFFVEWDPSTGSVDALKAAIGAQVGEYRNEYRRYYDSFAASRFAEAARRQPVGRSHPRRRTVRFRPQQRRKHALRPNFFLNAINVMAGATALEAADLKVGTTRKTDEPPYVVPTVRSAEGALPQARRPEQAAQFEQFHNYVALPRSEAFRIEYWALEEAKLQRMPAEAEFSRKADPRNWRR